MSWLTNVFTGGIGELVGRVGSIVDDLNLSGEEKQQFKLQLETLVQKRDSEIEQTLRTELGAKERVMIAELQQGDNYTKRMRPTLGYAGIGIVLLNHILLPAIGDVAGAEIGNYPVPEIFWAGWAGIMSFYSWGRTKEKGNRVTSTTTTGFLLKD